ncbi:MAG: HNH endonuclease [Pirellulales bacterium]|nr:HNH endonuclease [Pirellulales bacterium]
MAPEAKSEALCASVLVLNRFYVAVHVVGVRRAFGLLLGEMAEVIHDEDGAFSNYDFDTWREMSELRAGEKRPHDDWIKAVNFEIQVPRVIRLLFYDRMPRRTMRLSRHAIFARDGGQCQYCGRRFPLGQLSLDHVIPRSRGGMSTWENMVCACLKCNVKKGGRTPREARMNLIAKPVRPQRNPLIVLKLQNPKYDSWRIWIDSQRHSSNRDAVAGPSETTVLDDQALETQALKTA